MIVGRGRTGIDPEFQTEMGGGGGGQNQCKAISAECAFQYWRVEEPGLILKGSDGQMKGEVWGRVGVGGAVD